MFSITYIDKDVDGLLLWENLHGRLLQFIFIGRSTVSNMAEFYHPPSKKIYSSALYKLDPTLAAGPVFKLPYDGGIFFNTYHNEAENHQPHITHLTPLYM